MSGRKRTTVTILESEYQRLLAQERRLWEIRRVLPEVEETIRAVRAEAARGLEQVERRQQLLQQALQQVHTDFQRLEAETAHRLQRQQQQMRDALQDLRREMHQLVEEQGKRFQEMLAEERQARERQMARLQEQVDALKADTQRKMEIARIWIEGAQTMRDFINGNYRHQLFRPGALERLERDLHQAQENLNQGIPEAALAQAQRVYHELSDLRIELEHLEAEWHLWRSAALESAREILALAQAHRTAKAIDMEGKELDLSIEVDWWTGGRLSELEREVHELIHRLQDEENPLNLDDLRKVAEEKAPALRQRLEEIVRDARLAVIGSQLRINIADLIVQALREQGFEVQDATYEGQDMRGGYFVRVQHLDGSEVVVAVVPRESQPLENEVQIHSYDVAQRSERELERRAAELARALEVRGLQAPQPAKTGERPDPALRDIQQIRQRRVQVPLQPSAR